MKILFVVHGFPPETYGGTERVTEALARAMQGMGHEVAIVAGSMQVGPVDQVDREDWNGLRVLRVHRDDLYFESWFKTWHPGLSATLANLFVDERPDVVHVQHWLRLTSDVVRLARQAGAVAAVTVNDYFSVMAKVVRRHDEMQVTVPDRPPYMNDGEAEEALDWHRRDFLDELAQAHLRLSPSAAHVAGLAEVWSADPGEFQVQPPPLLQSLPTVAAAPVSGGQRLVCWGSLYPDKGLETVLQAMRLPQLQGCSLQVLGEAHDPAYGVQLEAMAQDLDVQFHGAFAAEDLARIEADYAVLPSLCRESYGLVVDEAQCLGLPILAADLPAYREHAQAGAAAFFAPGDANALAQAVADRGQLRPPKATELVDAEAAAQRLLTAYAAVERGAMPNRAFAVSERQRAHMLFRRLERRTWTALNVEQPPPVPPGDWMDR